MAIFEQYQVTSWKVGSSDAIAFPILSITETGGNRLVKRVRPYRDGAKLDDTGSQEKGWQMVAIFENSIQEEGIIQPIYPAVLNRLLDSFDIHQTGDLTLPTRGTVRARAENYSRVEVNEERDEARVTLTFCADNEDNLDAASFEQPSVEATARVLTVTLGFDAQSQGMWDDNLTDLVEFGRELEAFAQFPGNTVRDVDDQASTVINTTNRVGRTWSRETDRNNALLADPELSNTQRKLQETEDMAGRARENARAGRPRMVPYQVTGVSSLFIVSAQLRQAIEDLLDINPSIDPFFIPAGAVIRVFEQS